jgi:dipeptidyl aminopeptidase/acylaminoacyl peptidase
MSLITGAISNTSAQEGYRKPPKEVLAILDAPQPERVLASPAGPPADFALFYRTASYPSIEEVSAPMLRLAGLRINPRTNGRHLSPSPRVTELTIRNLTRGEAKTLKLPQKGKVGFPEWSPDGKWFATTVTFDDRVEVWLGNPVEGQFEPVAGLRLNAALADPVRWMPGERGYRLLCLTVPKDRGEPPPAPAVPSGPVVQESDGKPGPVRTYQDLLHNPHDESLFEHYATSQAMLVDPRNGEVRPVGQPGLITRMQPGPRGEFLLVARAHRPFSYLHTFFDFPQAVEVWNPEGKVIRTILDRPLQDNVPIEGVPTGPRAIRWHPQQPDRLFWVEAIDGGDPRTKVPHRDALYTARLGDKPEELLRLEHRFAGLDFYPANQQYQALISEYDRDRKWERTFLFPVNAGKAAEPLLVFDRSRQDRYGDPGSPLTEINAFGQSVLQTDPRTGGILLAGPGASPKGDRPFLDRFDPRTRKPERLFQCGEGEYAAVVDVLDDRDGLRFLIRRETPTNPPNYYLRDGDDEKKLTSNTDPAPELHKAKKELVATKRADGVTLSFTLYTPPGYKQGERLPTAFYAYPIEFASADTAGQVTGSPDRFTTVSGYSHLFFLTQGYAVMEVSMPVVGPPKTANDTFVEQLVANAKAAIDKAAEMGVVDPDRVGVMGHSYGAFMTANLLAHSDLFRAGIARSGAYNRTLTPFGFQNERRTFWEAPDVYGKMSPFFHATKINEPLLLIHGIADNNAGTFPVQSERLYHAIRGAGGAVRLVMLPHESHGYAARESIEHVLYEQIAWFDKYVKDAASRKSGGPSDGK